MRNGVAAIAIMALIGAAAFSIRQDAPWVLRNVSPSSPLGFYLYSGEPPGIGSFLAFRAEGSGFERVTDMTGLPMPTVPMLKRVIAGAGDHVCYSRREDAFRVNGGSLLGIQKRTFRGHEIPLWDECRDLGEHEYFVHSARIPNSLDSRFYGPVKASTVVGTYRPFWIDAEMTSNPITIAEEGH